MYPIRVLLIDDSTVMRTTWRMLLAPFCDIEIMADAENGRNAIQRVWALS